MPGRFSLELGVLAGQALLVGAPAQRRDTKTDKMHSRPRKAWTGPAPSPPQRLPLVVRVRPGRRRRVDHPRRQQLHLERGRRKVVLPSQARKALHAGHGDATDEEDDAGQRAHRQLFHEERRVLRRRELCRWVRLQLRSLLLVSSKIKRLCLLHSPHLEQPDPRESTQPRSLLTLPSPSAQRPTPAPRRRPYSCRPSAPPPLPSPAPRA